MTHPARGMADSLPAVPPLTGPLHQLWALLPGRARWQAGLLLLGILVGAGLEALGAGVVVPFITVVGRPEAIAEPGYLNALYRMAGSPPPEKFFIAAAASLLIVYVVKNCYLGLLLYLQYRFIYARQADAAAELLSRYLGRPYEFHIARNTAELLRNVQNEVVMTYSNVMLPAFVVLTEAAVAAAVIALLIFVAPLPALVVAVGLGSLTGVFYLFVRTRTRVIGRGQQWHLGEMIKWVNQSLGGIKETKAFGRESFFVSAFRMHASAHARANRFIMTVNQLPRLYIETIAVGAVLSALMVMLIGGNQDRMMPVLGLFTIAAMRVMPSLNRILASITRMRYYQPSLEIVYRDLILTPPRQPSTTEQRGTRMRLTRDIVFDSVTYRYPGAQHDAVRDVSFQIPRGGTVALVGASGAGKTTLIDLLLGLLHPTGGRILVDDRDIHDDIQGWQSCIGYIPQAIFLTDDSVRRNVAFGLPDEAIDDTAVWTALEAAQLGDFVRSLPRGLDTLLGERGVRFSGGQRQRIGIARALYGNPDVLVMDEATSALDEATESSVTAAIDQLSGDKTIVIIAHRKATIRHCTLVVELAKGELELFATRG